MTRLAVLVALAGCSGDTFQVALCPAPPIANETGFLAGVRSLRMTYSQVEDGTVVSQSVEVDEVDGFVTTDVVESGADLQVLAEGFSEPPGAIDDDSRILIGSTLEPVPVDGLRAVCVCMSAPDRWAEDCDVACQYTAGKCQF
ncbi:MAG: hypothetical protein HYY06_29600 [Deltaproteobacteria bacterium]|nr:hypothetical protein [Deltaproteobacteria bacterium]